MAFTLVQIDTLALDPTFRKQVRAAMCIEAESRTAVPADANNIIDMVVRDSNEVTVACYRAAFALRSQADPALLTDAQIKQALSVAMVRIYGA